MTKEVFDDIVRNNKVFYLNIIVICKVSYFVNIIFYDNACVIRIDLASPSAVCLSSRAEFSAFLSLFQLLRFS